MFGVASSSSSSSLLLRRAATSCSSGLTSRSYVTPSRIAFSAAAVQTDKKAPATSAPSPAHIPSSCPAGTPLNGLAILKEGPDVIALPDNEYPSWLWDLAVEPSMKTTYASLDASEVVDTSSSTGGGAVTKGQQRAKEKREAKQKRAAQAALERNSAKLARIEKASKGSQVDVKLQKKVIRDPLQVEEETKKALRKANRDKIRTNNFIRSS
ncbi:unnamed protein product [Sympodiomycopsis kandeliae]